MTRVIPMNVGMTTLSNTAGTNTRLGGADWDIPVWAKSVLAYGLTVQADLPTATEAIICRSDVTSDNVPVAPLEGFAAPLAGILGASGNGSAPGKVEAYDVNMKVNGGEKMAFNIRGLTAQTTVYGTGYFVVSDALPVAKQRKIKAGTLTTDTAVTATSADSPNPGTPYAINSASNIVELLGVMAPATPAGSEGLVHRIRFSSSEFAGINNVDLTMNPPATGLATLQTASVAGVSRQKCMVPIQTPQCNIADYWTVLSSTTLATATPWCSGVIYEVDEN